METIKNLEKTLDVKDVECKDCFKFYKYSTPMHGFCTRFGKHSSECRALCEKTQWYAEMCVLNSAIDYKLK